MKLSAILEARYGQDLDTSGLPDWVDVGMFRHRQHEKWVHQYIKFLRDYSDEVSELYWEIEESFSRCMPEDEDQWDGCAESLDIDYKGYFGEYSEIASQAVGDMIDDVRRGYDF